MIFDVSFSLYEGNASAKFRRKSARAQLGDCIGVDIAEISRILYILRIDSLYQTARQIAIVSLPFSSILSSSSVLATRSQRTLASCTPYYL